MLLGVHCSVAGGVLNAFNDVKDFEIDTFQIFTKNQRQWKEKTISEIEGKAFKNELKKDKIKLALSHCTYLINLASPDDTIRQNSVLALTGEVARCHSLGLKYCVLHPGSTKGGHELEGIKLIAHALNLVIKSTEEMKVKVLLENTAGQGSSIGWRFEQLKEIFDRVEVPGRLGVCIDTCHAFAAGYDIRTKSGFEDTISKLDNLIGIKNLLAFHVNDSKGDLGSRIDRHETIGKGKLGLEPFKIIMNKFAHIPKIIELPKEVDRENLNTLRSLVG